MQKVAPTPALLLVLAGGVSCSNDVTWFPWPGEAEAAARAILVIDRPQQELELLVLASGTTWNAKDLPVGTEISALFYNASGDLEEPPDGALVPVGEEEGCNLVDEYPPSEVYRLTVQHSEGGISAFERIDEAELAPDILALRTEYPPVCRAPCTRFADPETRGVPNSSEDATFGLLLKDSGNVLFGTRIGELFTFTDSEEIFDVRVVPPDIRVREITLGPGNQLWVGDAVGRVFPAEMTGETELNIDVTQTSTIPVSEPIYDLLVTPDARLVLTFNGNVFVDEGDGFRQLHKFSPLRPQSSPKGGFAADETGAVYFGWPFDSVVLRYRAGQSEPEDLTPLSLAPEAVSAIEYVPGIGVVFGTGLRGRLFGFDGRAFQELPDSEGLGIDLLSIAPFGPGLLYAGTSGFMREYIVGLGDCRPTMPLSSQIRRIIPLRGEDRLVVFGDNPLSGGEAAFALLRVVD